MAKARGSRRGTQDTTSKQCRQQRDSNGAAKAVVDHSEAASLRAPVVASGTPLAKKLASPVPTPGPQTQWDTQRKCLIYIATGEPVPIVEPVRHAMPPGAASRLQTDGLVPYVPSFTQYACDVRWREAEMPQLGTPTRDAVFQGCAADARFDQRQRCWTCPWWRLHPDDHPL